MKKRFTWKDSTNYTRDDTTRVPTSWTLRLTPDIRVSVVSNHIYHPGQWVVHCHPWFDTTPIGMSADTFSHKEAKERAIALVREKVRALVRATGTE